MYLVSFTLQIPIGGFWVSWSSLCFSSTRSWDKSVGDIEVDNPDLKLSPERLYLCHLWVCKLLLISLEAITGSFLLLNSKIENFWEKNYCILMFSCIIYLLYKFVVEYYWYWFTCVKFWACISVTWNMLHSNPHLKFHFPAKQLFVTQKLRTAVSLVLYLWRIELCYA